MLLCFRLLQTEPSIKFNPVEEEERIRRAAEREGRRTRRRRDRERIDIKNSHLDGMSSDDEVPDQETTVYKNQLGMWRRWHEYNIRKYRITNITSIFYSNHKCRSRQCFRRCDR